MVVHPMLVGPMEGLLMKVIEHLAHLGDVTNQVIKLLFVIHELLRGIGTPNLTEMIQNTFR